MRDISIDDLSDLLGENFHVSLRKVGRSYAASVAYRAIDEMSDSEWHSIVSFVAHAVIDTLSDESQC